MSLKFIIGRSGSGKTTACLSKIEQELASNPMGDPIIYLVPDQMTFQVEYELINRPAINGMIRAQVFSFNRLAWRILQETGGLSRYHLSRTGLNMLIRRIVEEKKDQLKVFKRSAEQDGFIQQLETMVAEFKRYCVSPEELDSRFNELSDQSEKTRAEEVLINKLHDFQLIYREFEHTLLSKYIDVDDYLHLLAEKLESSAYLKRAHIYVDGFHSFTPQEIEVLQGLMIKCKEMTVTLTIDETPGTFSYGDLYLYEMPVRTYQQLRQIAENQQVHIEPTINLNTTSIPRFKNAPSLGHLEQYYDKRPTVVYEGNTDIEIVSAVNRRAEVESVAREMIIQVRENNYRWRDFVILCRNSDDYESLIETLFEDHEIPVFMDKKRSMLNHPLIELIRSALDTIHTNWRYEAVFRCIKTELLFSLEVNVETMREQIDILENYVLANGIKGQFWKREWTVIEDSFKTFGNADKTSQQVMNDLRKAVVHPLKTLESSLKKSSNVKEMCETLFHFLEDLRIPKKLEELSESDEITGRLTNARDHEQVWDEVLELFDQMVELMGEEKVDFPLFKRIIETGFESLEFSQVPPAIDQVLIGSIEHSRFLHVKCTFILGANDGVLPARPKEDSVISEGERELLRNNGLELAPGSKQKLVDENYLIYLALSSPSERLWVSYPMANEEGKSLQPSIIIKRLKDMFPSIPERLVANEPNEEDEKGLMGYIVTPSKALTYLTAQLQLGKKGYPIPAIWWDVYNWIIDDPHWCREGEQILNSLFYVNEAKPLRKETSLALYGDHIQASVSRMELYKSCAFSQFISYGLRLKEREIFRLEAPDIGELFHSALKLISDFLSENDRSWSTLSNDECLKLAVEMVDKLAPKIQKEILLSTNRYQYIKKKLQEIVQRASLVLRDHAKISGFSPVGIELGFGKNQELPPIRFTLDNGCTMELAGRIDRVDKAVSAKGVFLRVIDYKSSEKYLNLDEVYYGLSLQMLTYLDVVITHSEKWLGTKALPAGVLYFHVHNPMLNKSNVPNHEQIEQELFKAFKMKGLLVGDEEAVQLMDQTLESGHSEIVPAGLKKSGGFYSNSSIASQEDFLHLQKYARTVIKKIGEDITNGQIEINPYKLKQSTPCRFCSYKPICQFDQTLDENNYFNIQAVKTDEILHRIREEAGDENE